MVQLIFKRLLGGLLTLWVVISLTFVLMRALPGGPFDQERQLPPEIKKNMEARFHLDKPPIEQYFYYLGGLVQGDLGPSYKYQSRRVNDIVVEGFWASFQIGFLAMVIGTILGLLTGTWAGITKNKTMDGVLSLLGVSSISMPSFIFGGFLVLLFALRLNWLPAATLQTPSHYLLPVATLSLAPFAYTFLLIRTTVKEMKKQPFVFIKRSFGVDEYTVTLKHVLRNSLLPLISILGPISATIITGSFAVEYIFAVPGLGKSFVTAVSNRDYTLVMGVTIVYSVLLIFFNMGTDILYGILDPRLRQIGVKEGGGH
jgi:oligopeptide transport system permease protein